MIRLFNAHIPKTAGDSVKELLNSGMVNRGIKAEEFESKFCGMFVCRYATSVNSGTSALRLALEIAKQRNPIANPEVITTPYTMVATNTAILESGCTPVFADVEYDTANISVEDIMRHITKHTIGIMGVEYAGYPCEWEQIINNVNNNNLVDDITLISDSAHALGATHHYTPIHEYVHMQCFSFQAIKHITTGDGGMIITDNGDVDAEVKKLAWFGINKQQRIVDALGARPADIEVLGFKYAMNDLNATLGLEGLKDFNYIFTRRATIASRYEEELCKVDGIQLMKYDRHGNIHANWMFPIHVKNRSLFASKMRSKGIEVAVHNWRNDQYTIFNPLFEKMKLPNTEKLNNDLIHIPLHAELTDEEVDYVIKTIKEICS